MDERSTIGNYKIISLLGQGSLGRVHLAFDANIGREVAVKELVGGHLGPNRERVLARFLREAKVTGRLEHPGIVPVYDLETKPDGSPYYVMRRVKGATLQDVIKGFQDEAPDAAFRSRMGLLDKFIDICDAVAYAHSKGVVHRDLKLANIVIGEFGETIVLDWGIAKILKEPEEDHRGDMDISLSDIGEDTLRTRQGVILGTPSYMAPEQASRDFGDIDQRTDVYSLGVILFVILTGRRPYQERAADVIEEVISHRPSPSPMELLGTIPPELSAICEKAMRKRQSERFADAAELAREMRAYRDGRMVSVYSYTRKELFRRFVSRNKIAIIAAAAIAVSVVAGAAFSIKFGIEAHIAKQDAYLALAEVTRLSESSAKISTDMAESLRNYISTLSSAMRNTAAGLKNRDIRNELQMEPAMSALHKRFPVAEGFAVKDGDIARFKTKNYYVSKVVGRDGAHYFDISVPIYQSDIFKGELVGSFTTEKFMPAGISFDPLASPYQVWCMLSDGLIIYDEDPGQIGKNIFTDAMYSKFPELQEFSKQVTATEWGIGHYKFRALDTDKIIHKVGAWDTVEPYPGLLWKLIIVHPYAQK